MTDINYETLYEKIVQNKTSKKYKGAKEQGLALKKYSILKPVGEISYSNRTTYNKEN